MRKPLRIFISSPGDVQEERLRAHLVVQKLARDYQRFFRIEPYLWEYEPMLASGHFQDAIEPPSQSDIVVLVVYSRLGTPLPERTAARAYTGIDGRAPVTGTEWEFEEALEAHRSRGAPDLLAYRKLGDPQASLADAAKRAEQERQWTALEAFWRRHFEGGGVFLAGSSKFQTLEEFDQKLETDLVRLIEARVAQSLKELAGGGEEATWLHGSPFQGLAAYDFHDSPIFFGRDAQIREASTRLQAAAASGTAFLLVLGASGSGKSSLARAGILPALFAAKAVPGVGLWRRVVLRPAEGGEDPVLGLAKALIAGNTADGEGLPELLGPGSGSGSGMGAEALAAHLAAAPDDPSFPFRQALGAIASEARRARGLLPHEEARLVILVDQIEELFTRDIDPVRRTLFVRILAGLARSGIAWVVGTVRNDLWHRAAAIPELVELTEAGARLDLPAPDGAEIIEIVRRPAAAAGVVFEKNSETGVGLDAVVSRAASEEPGALPLLSVVLQSLYRRDVVEAGGRSLTFAGYRELGELKGAIAQRADQALDELKARDPEAAAALPRLLRTLVTASSDGTATSRPARLDAFPAGGPEARLVEALVAADTRLLVASERDGAAEVRLAHEALLENWPTAREQIAVDRRDLQTRARLETLQRRWLDASSPADRKRSLLASLNLAEGVDLVRRWEISRAEGLGAYVAQSQAAETWRRRRFAIAASVLVLIFAGFAAVASLQWLRAEQQTVLARAAEETEREARASADQAREEAVRQRDLAEAERTRTLVALKQAKRSAAGALATQSELATDRSEIRRALQLAVTASETEADILEPGERGVSEPALLKALSEDRSIIQIDRPKGQGAWLPHDFYGNDAVVYGDADAGVMLVDLATGRARQLATLPNDTLPLHVRGVASLGLVVMTSVKNLFVIEVASGRIRSRIEFADRIGALDVDEGSRSAVVGTGDGVSFIDLDKPEKGAITRVPAPRPEYFVGQLHFLKAGRQVMVTYGADILRFDRDANAFGENFPTDLSVPAAGLSRELVDSVASQALVVFVAAQPDPTRNRLLISSVLNLTAVKADGTRFEYDRDSAEAVLGLGFTGADSSGDVVAITGKRLESGYEIKVAFVSEERRPLLFDLFRVSSADLGGEQLQSCRVSRDTRLLVCGYNGKTSQGIFVWHVVGGKHRRSRQLSTIGASVSAAVIPGPTPRMLVGTRTGLAFLPGDRKVEGPAWDESWRIESSDGAYVAATSTAGRIQVLRADGDTVTNALAPVDGSAVQLRANLDRAFVVGIDRVAVYDLRTGREVWSVPGIRKLKAADLRQDGAELVVLTEEAAYVFDGATGRIMSSRPVRATGGVAAAVDAASRRAVFVTDQGPQILDIASGEAIPLAVPAGLKATLAEFALGQDRIVLAFDDGRVVGFDMAGNAVWTAERPPGENYDTAILAGRDPKGTVRQIVVSEDGRVAFLRQDMGPIWIHDVASGQFLTDLTPVWMTGVAARVSFARDGRILSAWSLAAILRDKPSAATLHSLPRGRAEALAAAQGALQAAIPRLPAGGLRSGS